MQTLTKSFLNRLEIASKQAQQIYPSPKQADKRVNKVACLLGVDSKEVWKLVLKGMIEGTF